MTIEYQNLTRVPSLSLSYTDKPGSENSAFRIGSLFGEPAEFLLPGKFWRNFIFQTN
jgi:hypothetical protein